MQVNISASRAIINDPILSKIQNMRYEKHLQSLSNLKVHHSTSQYINPNNIAPQLDRYRKNREEVNHRLFPNDAQYLNCLKRIREIKKSGVKFPKINFVLKENNRVKDDQQTKIDHQNQILLAKFDHLDVQHQNKKKSLKKFIDNYETYRKLSRRFKEKSQNNASMHRLNC